MSEPQPSETQSERRATPPVLLLTRPGAGSERFAAQLPARVRAAVSLELAPLAEIQPTQTAVPDPDAFQFVVFTSENGVRMLGGAPRRLPAYCVGTRTAEAAKGLGYRVAHTAPDVSDLIGYMRAHPPSGPGLYARGVQVSRPLAEALEPAGIAITEAALYRQSPRDWPAGLVSRLNGAQIIAPLFSPHIAGRFRGATADLSADLAVVALSPAVASAVGADFAGEITICDTPDASAMIAAIEGLLDAWGKLERGGSPS